MMPGLPSIRKVLQHLDGVRRPVHLSLDQLGDLIPLLRGGLQPDGAASGGSHAAVNQFDAGGLLVEEHAVLNLTRIAAGCAPRGP
jgi:hypothetical protein